ncbi:hypothetical protein AAFC00_005682 [Neodothiora populina]|uniref:Autophagy-related protein 29 n=1 Tax=Neodothiora populina TaxID=2781224 RepID=A0ABR3P5H1_9PEZI
MSSITASREAALRPAASSLAMQQETTGGQAKPPAKSAAAPESKVHYTCFIRLPFPRADFVDPPQVAWTSTKDRALWKIISKASSRKELDCISARFDVSLSFLLQQAAWLYERHFAQMKAQMKKLSPSANPSPIPPDSGSNMSTPSTSNFAANILGPRTTSALSTRARDSPTPNAGSGLMKPSSASSFANDGPPSAAANVIPSRTPSVRTVTQQSRVAAAAAAAAAAGQPASPLPHNKGSFRSSFTAQQRRYPSQAHQAELDQGEESPPLADVSDSDSLSSDDDDDDNELASQSMARSQAFRRPPHLGGAARKGRGTLSYADEADEDEDEDDDGGFLPFAAAAGSSAAAKHEDPAATLRSPPPHPQGHRKELEQRHAPVAPDSSASSGSLFAAPSSSHHHHQSHHHHHQHMQRREQQRHYQQPQQQPQQQQQQQQQLGGHGGLQADPASALSPRRRAELSAFSPGAVRREGSEGTPSMGSSFSDLDADASISQSALEEAYLSNMQRGATASRMSTISQALRSKYL